MTATSVKRLFAILLLTIATGALAGCAGSADSGQRSSFGQYDGGGGA